MGGEVYHPRDRSVLSSGCIVIIQDSCVAWLCIEGFEGGYIKANLLCNPFPHFFLHYHWCGQAQVGAVAHKTKIHIMEVRTSPADRICGNQGVHDLNKRRSGRINPKGVKSTCCVTSCRNDFIFAESPATAVCHPSSRFKSKPAVPKTMAAAIPNFDPRFTVVRGMVTCRALAIAGCGGNGIAGGTDGGGEGRVDLHP